MRNLNIYKKMHIFYSFVVSLKVEKFKQVIANYIILKYTYSIARVEGKRKYAPYE